LERIIDDVEFRIDLEKEFSELSERDRNIIKKYLEGYLQREIGEEFGLSQRRVSQILQKIFKKIKKFF
jgi:RNA polymerase sigma factor (sigma-70 family)